MKITKTLTLGMAALCLGTTLSGCANKEDVSIKDNVSQNDLSQISALGFSTQNAVKTDGGYLVEGDIFLSDSDLKTKHDYSMLRVGDEEQYRTNNLVTGLPRNITISVATSMPAAYVTAVNEVVRRYNAEGLRVTFSRVASNGAIRLSPSPTNAGYLASAGFPSGGNPYNQVLVNVGAIGTANATTYIATILAHEVGHCIGFRHTDYADRSYSCGGQYTNEGASSVGAIQVPGTPAGADPNSWMLACVGSGQNRPFNGNDRTALNYIY